MSQVAHTVEPVVLDPEKIRRPMTIARKRRIHGNYDGKCGGCRKPVPLKGPGVTYDHEPPIEISLRDVDEDVRPLCDDCNKPKTATDQGIIAHVHRIIRKAAGTWNVNRQRIQSRGFPKDLRKRLNGRVERRS